MKFGERQVAPTLGGIRGDHVQRYKLAAKLLPARSLVLDAACGVGYGSKLLQESADAEVIGVDICEEAIQYAREHYGDPRITYAVGDALEYRVADRVDAVVSFETIEHVEDDLGLVQNFARQSNRLIASVPNELLLPFDPKRFNHHVRHYTPTEFEELLTRGGWTVRSWYCQADAQLGKCTPGKEGRTIVVDAVRA